MNLVRENIICRAARDTTLFFRSWAFWFVESIVVGTLAYTASDLPAPWPVVIPIMGILSVLAIVFLVLLVIAPFKQRDEAWAWINEALDIKVHFGESLCFAVKNSSAGTDWNFIAQVTIANGPRENVALQPSAIIKFLNLPESAGLHEITGLTLTEQEMESGVVPYLTSIAQKMRVSNYDDFRKPYLDRPVNLARGSSCRGVIAWRIPSYMLNIERERKTGIDLNLLLKEGHFSTELNFHDYVSSKEKRVEISNSMIVDVTDSLN